MRHVHRIQHVMSSISVNTLRPLRWIVLVCVLASGFGAHSQTAKQNLAKFDYRSYHFGFLLSGNSSSFNFNLRPDFTFSDSLLSVENNALSGFNLALLASLNVNNTIRIRFIPGLSFQDRGMLYRFRAPDGTIQPINVRTESVYLDFPLLIKLRTDRIGNFAPYALFGGKLSRDMQSQADVNQSLQDGYILKLAKGNASLDFGAGADFFLPFFKFSVEMKTEFGMRNVLIQDDTPFSAAFDQLRTRSFIISFTFEG
ncbi:MAG: PorT family protein [Flavobacteriales bacterium]|nr:PorT family protein [Flavobacteriales bacterium]